ncbi:MAG: hypothetical protein ACLRQQ_13845 [Acutalibacteraceae bacterium]
MKTIVDLENMKSQKCIPFESAYEYLISALEDYYIAKSNGKERIKHELSNWDSQAQSVIIETLIARISPSLQDFNPSDLRELLQ